MMTTHHPLATAWLDRVAALATDLPAGARSELLADLAEHLDAALAGVDDPDEVRAVLARLGDPADVVAAARDDEPDATGVPGPDTMTSTEALVLAGLVLTGLLGLVLVAVLGPLLALVPVLLAWGGLVGLGVLRGRWRGTEVVGLALLPVGWGTAVLSWLSPVSVSECTIDAAGAEVCTGSSPDLVLLGLAVVGLVLLGVWTRWLARAPRGRPARRR